MLEVRGLHAEVNGIEILKGVDLSVGVDETHAIMGPNGSGKSTLAYVLAGRPGYEVTEGSVTFDGEDLLALPAEERARRGLFLSFQHPVEIPGVRMDHFLRAGYNELRKNAGEEQLDPLKFDRLIRSKAKAVEMEPAMTKRAVNEGFSGGEKKRNEVLQMAVLEPRLRILDEIDSGLDVDALREVATRHHGPQRPRHVHHPRDPLRPRPLLPRTGPRPRAHRRPHRALGRQGAREGDRGARLRLARGRSRRLTLR